MTPEQMVHKSIATFLDLALTPPDWYTTFPAGGGGKVRGAILKMLGLKVGVPDILLIRYPARAYWLEVKPGKKKAEDHQKACHVRLALAGSKTAVVHNMTEAHDALAKWGFPLRISINDWGNATTSVVIMRDAAE